MYGVILSVSDFTTPSWRPDQTLYATRWQIRRVGFDWWHSTTIDTDWDVTNTDPYFTGAVLNELFDYEARVGFMDQFFEESPWSDPVSLPALFDPTSPPVHGSAGAARQQNLFFGTTDAILLADSGTRDRGVAYPLLLRTAEVMPAGMGGDNIFGPLYVTVANLVGVTIFVTPICDGRRLATIPLVLTTLPSLRRRTYEIDLREPYDVDAIEVASQGLRGQSFAVELAIPAMAHTRLEILGIEVEYESVQETFPDITFTPEALTDVTLELPSHTFAGSAGNVLQMEDGADDFGTNIVAQIGTDDILPDGESGECTFRTLYLAVTRNNTTALNMELVPCVEGIEGDPIPLVFDPTADVLAEIRDIDLSVPYIVDGIDQGRFDRRGNAISFTLRTVGGLPGGTFILEGSELEYFSEQESMEPVNA